MKKITLAFLILLGTFSMASADLGINIGISGNLAIFHAEGNETETGETNTEDATGVAAYSSLFIEKTIGNRFTVGYDYVPDGLASEQAENKRKSQNVGGALGTPIFGITEHSNIVKVEFKDLTTAYVTFRIVDNFYAKVGHMSVDMISKEVLGTGSNYGDTTLDGQAWGFGYNKTFDNSMFLRSEFMRMDFDSAMLTSSTNADNTVQLNSLDGARATISVGKSF